MVDLLTLALLGLLFMGLWEFTQCEKKTIILIIVLSPERQNHRPQALGYSVGMELEKAMC